MLDARSRVRAALDHREADRVPRDLGGTRYTGIHVDAYRRFREQLGLAPAEPAISDFQQRLAAIDGDVLDLLGLDVKGAELRSPSSYQRVVSDDGEYLSYVDIWGVGRRMPKDGGLFYDPFSHPLAGDIGDADLDGYTWPDPADPGWYEGLVDEAHRISGVERRAVYVGSICSGLTEVFFRLRGFEDGYMDLAANPRLARRIMERVLELKLAYWGRVLPELGDLIDVASEADDVCGQSGPLFSPAVYRDLVKPLHKELFDYIHAHSRAKVFLHCCGAARTFIPDFIDEGVDILNPVQVSAEGMDSAGLKRDFGRDVVFWGGGVDTQRVLSGGTPGQVRDDVRRHVEDLKTGGGFVFGTVHNIQANVPAENVVAMWEAEFEAGEY